MLAERINSKELKEVIQDYKKREMYDIVDLRSKKEYDIFHIPYSKN